MRTLLMVIAAIASWQAGRWQEVTVIDGDPIVRGAPKDGWEVLDSPPFISSSEAAFMEDGDLVIGLVDGEDVRVYPVLLLYGREIVNDTIGETPVTVTW